MGATYSFWFRLVRLRRSYLDRHQLAAEVAPSAYLGVLLGALAMIFWFIQLPCDRG
jgi:hypothetical protein